MASISERESREIEAANASGTTPVVFIHGLWLLPSSWAKWAELFKQAGYAPLTPDWPDDPETVEEARANPDVLAKKTLKKVADHTADVIGKLEKKPAVVGHSTGGLFAQMLAGRGLSAATVAIDPGVFRGVLAAAPLHAQGEWTFPVEPRGVRKFGHGGFAGKSLAPRVGCQHPVRRSHAQMRGSRARINRAREGIRAHRKFGSEPIPVGCQN